MHELFHLNATKFWEIQNFNQININRVAIIIKIGLLEVSLVFIKSTNLNMHKIGDFRFLPQQLVHFSSWMVLIRFPNYFFTFTFSQYFIHKLFLLNYNLLQRFKKLFFVILIDNNKTFLFLKHFLICLKQYALSFNYFSA